MSESPTADEMFISSSTSSGSKCSEYCKLKDKRVLKIFFLIQGSIHQLHRQEGSDRLSVKCLYLFTIPAPINGALDKWLPPLEFMLKAIFYAFFMRQSKVKNSEWKAEPWASIQADTAVWSQECLHYPIGQRR